MSPASYDHSAQNLFEYHVDVGDQSLNSFPDSHALSSDYLIR